MHGVTFGRNRRSTVPEVATRRAALYARVSTDGQSTDAQIHALQELAKRHQWHVVSIHIDKGISGTRGRDARPQFDALQKAIARRDIDVVAAWSVDRLGRSLQDLIPFLGDLRAKDVDLVLVQQGLDTSTPSGRAMFQLLGVFAEFEASMIRERVRAGISMARRKGTKSGRAIGRPKIDPKIETAAKRALNSGKGILKVARELKIGTGTVSRISAEMRNQKPLA